MNLKEELARQSLLLQFIADCAGLNSIGTMLDALASHLRWIADHDVFTVLLPDDDVQKVWAMSRGGDLIAIEDAELSPAHQSLITRTRESGSPCLAPLGPDSVAGLGLPLGAAGRTLGVLLLMRMDKLFSHSDVRHLQHASRAVGAALARIVGTQTERRAQRAIDAAEARLRALAEDRALFAEQMIGIVSHDLRNPLAAVAMGAAALSRGQELPPQKTRVLQNVVSATHRARRLIDDLLDFTVTRVGKGLQVTRAALDFHELVSRSVDELSLTFEGRIVHHQTYGEGSVTADADRMEQVLGNLVANAVKYGDQDAPIIVTSAIDGDTATLSVHNQGKPIPCEIRTTLFEPMVRGAVTNSSVRSVGLGLFIVRAVADAHHGSVDVVSSTAEGTTFTFRFPANDR